MGPIGVQELLMIIAVAVAFFAPPAHSETRPGGGEGRPGVSDNPKDCRRYERRTRRGAQEERGALILSARHVRAWHCHADARRHPVPLIPGPLLDNAAEGVAASLHG